MAITPDSRHGVTADDLRAQLNTILHAPKFKRSPNPSAMLRLAVDCWIAGSSLPESVVAKQIFPKHSDDSPIVRVTARNLRRLLGVYYDGPGRHDPVMIEMPVGGYTVTVQHRNVKLVELIPVLNSACPPDPRTVTMMGICDYQTSMAIDGCFEIHHSYLYKGWHNEDFEFTILPDKVRLPKDLEHLTETYPVSPPNNGKYHVHKFIRDSTERKLSVTLKPTDYFSTRPIEKHLYERVLVASSGDPVSPIEKYGVDLLDFDHCLLPNIVCAHIIVVLPDERLLLTQRVHAKEGGDWELGKWTVSIEEQMSSDVRKNRNVDQHFFDTVRAGVEEELGYTLDESAEIKILSIVVDSSFVIEPIALVFLPNDLATVRADWEFRACDGRAELRRVADVPWSLEALIPALAGEPLALADATVNTWHLTSRMRIAVALFHKYGIEKTALSRNL